MPNPELPVKQVPALLDKLDRIREELLSIQNTLEKMARPKPKPKP